MEKKGASYMLIYLKIGCLLLPVFQFSPQTSIHEVTTIHMHVKAAFTHFFVRSTKAECIVARYNQ